MNKNEFFLKAIKANAFLIKSWIISCFSIIHEDVDKWKEDPYAYRVIQTPAGAFFIDPESKVNETGFSLTPIEGYSKGSPIFSFKDRITLKAGDVVNLKEDIETTTGNLLFNLICVINAFDNKLPYINKKISLSDIENQIANLLNDTPDKGEERSKDKLYVDEYIKFVDAVFYLTNFSQLCVWGATEKVLTAPPGIKEFKKQLLEKYKDSLTDDTTLAKIDAELVAFDAAYLKGDPGENFLLSNKSRAIVRKRKFLNFGAERGIDEKTGLVPIFSSLEDGWEVDKFPIMMDNLRSGVFKRGAETELGGESVKWLLRASSNIVVTVEDCGTKLGELMNVTQANHKKLIDFSVLINNETKTISNEEESSRYIGETLMIRTPMYCKLDKTDYCKICVGRKLSENPTGLSMTISEYGSEFLTLFMKAMHGKQLEIVKIDTIGSIT